MSNIGRMILATNDDTIIMLSERVYIYAYNQYKFDNITVDNPTLVHDWLNYHGYKELL